MAKSCASGDEINSVLTATLGADYGSVSASIKMFVTAIASCRLPKAVTHGRTTNITCKGSRVAAGTKVTLYFKYPHAGMHVLGHARFDAKGRATITFVSRVRKETVLLWLRGEQRAVRRHQQFPASVRMI